MDTSNYTVADYTLTAITRTTEELLLAVTYTDNPALYQAAITELRGRDNYRAIVDADYAEALAMVAELDAAEAQQDRLDRAHSLALPMHAQRQTTRKRWTDLPVITVAELNRAYEDLVSRLADYSGVHGDMLHARLQAIVDELHTRAWRMYVDERLYVQALDENKTFDYCAAGGHMLRCCLSCLADPGARDTIV